MQQLLKPPRANWLADWRSYVVYAGFILIFVIFSITLSQYGFLTTNNLLNIIRQTATISVMAVAMTFVIASGEIDLSVGSIAGLSSVIAALTTIKFGFVAGALAGLLVGAFVGLINGLLTTRVGIPSFLVTLGMLGIANGTAMWLTASAPVPILSDTFNNFFGSGNLGPVPSLFLWTLIALGLGHFMLRKTPFGRKVLATGGNPVAARYSGIDTMKVKLFVLVASGAAAGIAGMLYAGRLNSGRFQWGQGDELSVIAAVILGGTPLAGGLGSVFGTVLGALMIGLINNGLILMGLDYSQQLIIRGLIIILAVALARR
ncbi:ABC transporter permease [Deinococcus petrolearius]|uniref:ABC transporter permease n=1 Tax=Deinococcus petrolearius TaxID=1751295 RepID=A0ABW1DJT7_9DEIO